MRNRRALTLIELLVTLLILGIVMGAAMKFFIGQSTTFRRGSSDSAMLMNMRAGVDLLNQHFRALGANLVDGQPPMVYSDDHVLSFNADYATKTAGDLNSIYYTPNATDAEVQAITVANQILVPGQMTVSYPTFNYQVSAGVMSPAEMITFWFAPDTETTRTDDYVLYRQVNNSAAEGIVRNILKDTVPFFRYLYQVDSGGGQRLDTLPASKLPLRFDDTASYNTINNLRAVIVSYVITNGLTGPAERKRPLTIVGAFPNLAARQLETCGNNPLPMNAPTIVAGADTRSVDVTWTADGDETGGERDIMSYMLWRRKVGTLTWSQPFISIPAGNPPTYHFHDSSVPLDTNGNWTFWEYAVAAADCTPNYSDPVAAAGNVGLLPAP